MGTDYTRKNLTSCSKSAYKLSTSCVRYAYPKLSPNLERLVDNLFADLQQLVRFYAYSGKLKNLYFYNLDISHVLFTGILKDKNTK